MKFYNEKNIPTKEVHVIVSKNGYGKKYAKKLKGFYKRFKHKVQYDDEYYSNVIYLLILLLMFDLTLIFIYWRYLK